MRRTSILTALAVSAIVSLAGVGVADEVWSTDIGDVIYEADLESGHAVLSYPTSEADIRGTVFLEGMAGVYTGRTGFEGVWIEPDLGAEGCGIEMVRPDTGETSRVWGRAKLLFVDPDFPGSWIAIRGDCFDEPTETLVGRPITAQ
ncbi:MAG: hypothetical protein Hens3KO_27600 [Henriciella sp.]